MPIFITLSKQTPEGIKDLKNVHTRAANAQKSIEKAGGRIIGAYATLGRYDYVYITEFPDEKSVWKSLTSALVQADVSSETLVAMPMEEFVKVAQQK